MPQIIEGKIKTDTGITLPGVAVSNGLDIVQTDGKGMYALPKYDGTRFVSITTPAGYAVPRFYNDLQQSTDRNFVLQENPAGLSPEFSFVQITDMHISTERRAFSHHLKDDLARIYEDVGDRLSFLIATGDLTAGGKPEEFQAYLEAVETIDLPVYHAAGNHDDDADVTGTPFMDHLGPMHYSFDFGPVHFAVYDGEHYKRDGSTLPDNYDEDRFRYVPSTQDAWLRDDLSLQPADRPVILINHFPWGDDFYRQWRDFPLIATLSGHWHTSRIYPDGNITHYNTPPLGFGGIDHSPRAYRIFTYKDNRLTSEIRALVPKDVFTGIGFRPAPDNKSGRVDRYSESMPTPDGHWPMFQGNPQRTGAADSSMAPPLTPVWRAGTGSGIHMAAPVIAEGKIFQAVKHEDHVEGNRIEALDAENGSRLWSAETDTAVKRAPVYHDGHLFAMTVTGRILALSADAGQPMWTFQLDNPSHRWTYTAPLAYKGRIYAGVSSHFVAMDVRTGETTWQRRDLGHFDWIASYASPAAKDDYLAVAFFTQPLALAVLDAHTGQTIWQIEGSKPYYMYAGPVIGAGMIYTVSGSMVRAFDLKTGTLCWETSVSIHRNQVTPALADGRLFITTGAGTLYALDASDGHELWQWHTDTDVPLFTSYGRDGGTTLSSPVVANGFVYVSGADGHLYAVDADTGTCTWQHDLGVPLAAGPAISGDSLWVGGCDGFLYAFTASGG